MPHFAPQEAALSTQVFSFELTFSFTVGAGFARPETVSFVYSGRQTLPLR